MKFNYRSAGFPAIPVVQVRLGYPGQSPQVGPVEAIVDSGADGCLIPMTLLDAVEAPLVDQIHIRSHWGERRQANLYTVDIAIGELTLLAVEAVGDPGQEIILGRNALNRLRIVLDGPKQVTEIK